VSCSAEVAQILKDVNDTVFCYKSPKDASTSVLKEKAVAKISFNLNQLQ